MHTHKPQLSKDKMLLYMHRKLEGTFKGHVVQLPCSEQRHVQLDQVAQSLIQPHFENLQGWGINHISRQPVPVPHHPHCKRLFPYIQAKPALFKLEAIFPCCITTDPAKETVHFFPVAPLQILKSCYQVTSESPFLQAEQPQLSQPVLTGEVFHPLDRSSGPPLDMLQQLCI